MDNFSISEPKVAVSGSINGAEVNIKVFRSNGISMLAVDDGAATSFIGKAKNDIFYGGDIEQMKQLLIDAVNNRTRERNYFKLLYRLYAGEITDEDFDKEIDEHEDDYVINTDKLVSKEIISKAVELAKHIKDVNTAEDFVSLFSINEQSLNDSIHQLENE